MKPPLFVRNLTEDELHALERALRSNEAFTVRRAQILRLSNQRQRPSEIASHLGLSRQGVREVIHAFEERGLDCLRRAKMGPKSSEPIFDETKRDRLLDLAHKSPREFGRARSVWTLETLAEVAFEAGLTPEQVSHETVRQAIHALGSSWKRAKHWITSPDAQYALKKHRDRLIRLAGQHEDWALGYVDEVWWSRLAQPNMHAWCRGKALRLVQKPHEKTDPDPKALACYGVFFPSPDEMLLRFAGARPVSQVTTEFLDWVCARLEAAGKRVWALIWDNASWHKSQKVRRWIRAHNARVKAEGGVRIVVCLLPVQSPWLNPIEPKWLHGKRAIVEPERKLTAEEVIERVHGYYGCERLEPIANETA